MKQFPTGNWPIESPVKIFWHERMIPFVEAESDRDCAFAIGVVQAHLRWGQIELFRRITQGRLSEMAGPYQVPELDHALRTIDLGRKVDEMYAALNEHEKIWMDRFVEGINFYIENSQELPAEFEILNWEKEPWTALDVLRIVRLAGIDISWMSYARMLALKNEPGFSEVWKKFLEDADNSIPSVSSDEKALLPFNLSHFSRSGSNSLVVSGQRTESGAALIANDPHLGIFAPNFWVLMGFKSPSYHVTGFMIPGTPSVAVGRNQDIAWGGTNMRGISSHLFEVRPDQITSEREETIKVRWWFDKTVKIRESVHGPVISDLDFFKSDKPIALKWTGHQVSQDFSAFLGVNRATNWKEFRESFKGYAVSAQNMTYADKKGNVGMVLAVRQPILKDLSEMDLLIKSPDNDYASMKSPLDLPEIYNPDSHYIASSNNMPIKTEPRLAYSYSDNDRVIRWQQLLQEKKTVDITDAKRWQLDVFSEASYQAKKWLVAEASGIKIKPEWTEMWTSFSAWDGHYKTSSKGAVAFEAIMRNLALLTFSQIEDPLIRERTLKLSSWKKLLREKVDAMAEKEPLIEEAIEKSLSTYKEFSNWGEMHVQVFQHVLGNLPVIGERFQFRVFPAPGSTTTIHKAAFAPGLERREVNYGAQARHVSDLKDIDENYFVLLGGNDGWLKNPHIDDQIDLWNKGEYIRIPLRIESVRASFRYEQMEIRPGSNLEKSDSLGE